MTAPAFIVRAVDLAVILAARSRRRHRPRVLVSLWIAGCLVPFVEVQL